MGKNNPLSATANMLSMGTREVGRNPEKALIGGVFSPIVQGPGAVQKEAERKNKQAAAGAALQINAANAQATADKLNAEESVRAQQEKSRKQTIFGGASGANLFNKSLIGSSTTAAAGTQRSILGA